MRNITAFAVLVIIGFFHSPPSAAQEHGYDFTLSPQFGIVSGQAEEIVYPSDTKAELLSQLLWDMKPVFYYGLALDISRSDQRQKWGFFSNLSLKNGIPGKSGYMEDRDWKSVVNTDLTNYSRHDNHTRELFLLDFSAGLSFPFINVLVFKAFVNVSSMRFSFFGTDGYKKYARENPPGSGNYYHIDDNPDYEEFSGKVISYSQEWLTAAPGVSLVYYFLPGFSAELSFMASPLIMCAGLDEHKARNVQFLDYMQGGMLFEPGFRLTYSVTALLAVSWDFSWRYISGTRGASYESPIGSDIYVQSGEAGGGLSIINAALGLRVKL